jgi:CheY-like chemotaxis protein
MDLLYSLPDAARGPCDQAMGNENGNPYTGVGVSHSSRRPPGGHARILVVDDQDDVRQMLVTALGIDGYEVDEAADAYEGLKRLEGAQYDLVLTDYSLPGGTGTWMLHQAFDRGLMDGTDALIVTAHPDVDSPDDVEVITKPVELDRFLDQVRRLVDAGPRRAAEGSPMDVRSAPAGQKLEQEGHKVELVLYVSAASPTCIQARRNLERLLEQFDRSQVKFTICDLERDPLAGAADRIAFTPTLVKRFPEPRMWVLGNLRESQILADLLRVYGVDGSE